MRLYDGASVAKAWRATSDAEGADLTFFRDLALDELLLGGPWIGEVVEKSETCLYATMRMLEMNYVANRFAHRGQGGQRTLHEETNLEAQHERKRHEEKRQQDGECLVDGLLLGFKSEDQADRERRGEEDSRRSQMPGDPVLHSAHAKKAAIKIPAEKHDSGGHGSLAHDILDDGLGAHSGKTRLRIE